MDLLKEDEIESILNNFDKNLKPVRWYFEEFAEKIVGYLGDHLKLIIHVKKRKDAEDKQIKLFVKCMPRFDEWKANYLRELKFFMKEYVMLNSLFREFQNNEGELKWRPNLLYIREDLFVFEDVHQSGYKMPNHRKPLTIEELTAIVKALAVFHAQSYIYEENLSKKLHRPYRIWEDYKEYLQEPVTGYDWRNTGRNAAIDYLKVFSQYRLKADFSNKIETVIPELFEKALTHMKPSSKYRNAVIHRDLWTNNIFISETDNGLHAMFVDFQTVLYSSPMLDLSSVIYFNTTKSMRDNYTMELINTYYDMLSDVLRKSQLNPNDIFPRKDLIKAYNESLVFSATQAALIVPIVAMDSNKREEIFCNPERNQKANVVSRSAEFIEIASEDTLYRERVTELLDDIVEMFVYPKSGSNILDD